jgi:hypothetical protein
MTGVLVALAVGWLFTPKAAEDALTGRMRRLTGRVLADMAARLADASLASSREARDHDPRAKLRSRLLPADFAVWRRLMVTRASFSSPPRVRVRAARV